MAYDETFKKQVIEYSDFSPQTVGIRFVNCTKHVMESVALIGMEAAGRGDRRVYE
jgi:hypothetical protein